MRNFFLSPRFPRGSDDVMIRYSLAACIFAIALGETIRSFALAWFLSGQEAILGAAIVLALVILLTLFALKFTAGNSGQIAVGAVLVFWANCVEQVPQLMPGIPWIIPAFLGWWIIVFNFSAGPDPNGWGQLPPRE